VLPSDRSGDPNIAHRSIRVSVARRQTFTNEAWREAMAIRSMGIANLPLGIGVGIGAAVAAYIAAYFATVVESGGSARGVGGRRQ
jgi:hypothetical protein